MLINQARNLTSLLSRPSLQRLQQSVQRTQQLLGQAGRYRAGEQNRTHCRAMMRSGEAYHRAAA